MSAPLATPAARTDTVRIHVLSDDALMAERVTAVAARLDVEAVGSDEADVVVLCCRAIRSREADIVRSLRRERPGVEVVIVAPTVDVARVRLALEAGAGGIVQDDAVPTALGPALGAVSAGQLSLPASFRAHDAKPTLTTREKQILGLVVMGLSNGEIGGKLFLAESTVKSHLSSAFTKLGVRSRNEATARILDPTSGLGPGILRVTETLGPAR